MIDFKVNLIVNFTKYTLHIHGISQWHVLARRALMLKGVTFKLGPFLYSYDILSLDLNFFSCFSVSLLLLHQIDLRISSYYLLCYSFKTVTSPSDVVLFFIIEKRELKVWESSMSLHLQKKKIQ